MVSFVFVYLIVADEIQVWGFQFEFLSDTEM